MATSFKLDYPALNFLDVSLLVESYDALDLQFQNSSARSS